MDDDRAYAEISKKIRDADAEWKRIQEKTFTRWANKHLHGTDTELQKLNVDLCDGVHLILLLKQLSSGRLNRRYNKRPRIHAQKMENVELALKFITEDEHIRLVNIGSGDIVSGNLKLITGLVWTLILHYSIAVPMNLIGGPGKKPTAKQVIVSWIKRNVSDLHISNLTTDWNDGRAIGALVDAVQPGLCPDWKSFEGKDCVENATKAMDAAERELGIPKLLAPEDMVNPNVDELSMMTYLSQFLVLKGMENGQGASDTSPVRPVDALPPATAENICKPSESQKPAATTTEKVEVQEEKAEEQEQKVEEQEDKVEGEPVEQTTVQEEKVEVQNERVEDQGEKVEVQDEKVEDQDEKAEDRDEKVEDQDEKAEDQDEKVEDQGEKVEDQDEKVEDQDEKVEDQDEKVEDQDEKVEDQDEKVEDQDEKVEDQDEKVEDQDEKVEDQDEKVEDQDEKVEDQDEKVEDRDEKVEDQEEKVEDKDEKMEDQDEKMEDQDEKVEDQNERLVEQDRKENNNNEKVENQEEKGEVNGD